MGLGTPRSLRVGEAVVFASLLGWLVVAAVLVDVEYYDGLDSILNARFFAGELDAFVFTRAPLLALLLLPGEWLRPLGADPLELRSYHAVTAVLHGAYFVAAYALLCRIAGRSPVTLLAFVAAVPSFVVLSYAPFASDDIAPGALALAMIVVAERCADRTGRARRLAFGVLALLGAALALFKFTYALVLVALLAAVAIRNRAEGRPPRELGAFAAAAAASAAIVWLAICAVRVDLPDTPFFLRGVEQVEYLLAGAHQTAQVEPLWVYARNAPAFGILATLLVGPGLVLSWRAGGVLRTVAVVWVLLVAAFHVLPVRQVRYLAWLGALTAPLLVPVLQRVVARRGLRWAALAVLAVDWLPVQPYANLSEAARVASPFYRDNPVRAFLGFAEDDAGSLRTPVLMTRSSLSALSRASTPLRGDVYHGVFHLGIHQLDALFGLGQGELIMIDGGQDRLVGSWPDSTVLLHGSSEPLVQDTGWARRPPRNAGLRQLVLLPASVAVGGNEAGLRFEEALRGDTPGFALTGASLDAALGECLMPRAVVPGEDVARVADRVEGGVFVPGERPAGGFEVRFFRAVAELVHDGGAARVRVVGGR